MMTQFAARTSAFSGVFHRLLGRQQQRAQQLLATTRFRYYYHKRILPFSITMTRTNDHRCLSSSSSLFSSSSSNANVNEVNRTNSGTTTNNYSIAVLHQRGKINLRNATIDDIPVLKEWDKQPHIQDPNVMGDSDYNDWNWEYELSQDKLTNNSWRRQYIADLHVDDVHTDCDSTNPTAAVESNVTIIPIGFIQITVKGILSAV